LSHSRLADKGNERTPRICDKVKNNW